MFSYKKNTKQTHRQIHKNQSAKKYIFIRKFKISVHVIHYVIDRNNTKKKKNNE